MGDDYKESLIIYLSSLPATSCAKDYEVEQLIADTIITREEAAMLNMRIAAQRLNNKVDLLVEKVSEELNAKPCAAR
jgi:hypothetical protein